ncbi:MAG: hypothetical protein OXI56_00105 [bacterium]|nr:hypothetical protein [bacterium]MDE0600178.1 hypothetical protein [bacterium]
MTDEERAQIIALCEDPDEDFGDLQGRPPTPEEIAMVASLAETLFLSLSPQQQVDDILHLPTHVSARLLAQMSGPDRDNLLSLLASQLSEDIRSLLPVGSA